MSDADRLHPQAPTAGTATVSREADRPVRHLTQAELARRWRMSVRSLERWRLNGQGPPHLRIGGVLYRLEDVDEYERTHLHQKAARRSRTKPGSDSQEIR